jgi:glycerol-3-phosphate dehydrogenase
MNRKDGIDLLRNSPRTWDIIIVGGGATGLGVAVDAASRGYTTLLLEQSDFAKGTSSRSTKLIHGGVRYLQQGNIPLVLEALRERGLLLQNAPHVARNQAFIVPNYHWWEAPFYGIGLKLYDMLAGKLGLGRSRLLSRKETLKQIPTLEPEGLKGGVLYYDGQFDDSRLAVNLAQTAVDYGATVLNYLKVISLKKTSGLVSGVTALDMETGEKHEINCRVVVNATGVFAESVMKMDDPQHSGIIAPSQGVHLVLDKKFLPGQTALMVPRTDDGRVLFAIPWLDKLVVGTTDTAIPESSLEPRAYDEEINFILKHAKRYLAMDPERSDILSVFVGIRPLFKACDGKNTAKLSREHVLLTSKSGLVTITGGKWTTYRKMAQDTVNKAAVIAALEERPCRTEHMKIHGWLTPVDESDLLHCYGSDMIDLKKLINDNPDLGQKLHKELPYVKGEVVWAVRNEMARTVEDVLSRRTRSLVLNANASMESAPEVARIMAEELGFDKHWQEIQVEQYVKLAKGYLPDGKSFQDK